MSLVAKIEEKIKNQQQIPKLLEKIDSILSEEHYYLEDTEKKALLIEKLRLENDLIEINMSFAEKNQYFLYTKEEISQAPEITWLIPNVVPESSIGVLIGPSGSGKSTLAVKFCSTILERFENVHIVYIDGDMGASKIKEQGVGDLMAMYLNRFFYAGKNTKYFSSAAQKLMLDIINEQKKYPERVYFVIQDSLTLVSRKKRGFIDTEFLYENERKLRDAGGATLILHHTNKAGIFADSQQIENFADYTYLAERNDFNSCILIHPQKASRFDIQGKAFLTENRKILKEVDYDISNVSQRESKFVLYVQDALEDGEMNQREILSHLDKMRYFIEFKVGQKKAIKWLQKWSEKGKWVCERRPAEKNAIIYKL